MQHLFEMRQSSCVHSLNKLPFPLIRELFSHRSFLFHSNNPYMDIYSCLITNISFIARTITFGRIILLPFEIIAWLALQLVLWILYPFKYIVFLIFSYSRHIIHCLYSLLLIFDLLLDNPSMIRLNNLYFHWYINQEMIQNEIPKRSLAAVCTEL